MSIMDIHILQVLCMINKFKGRENMNKESTKAEQLAELWHRLTQNPNNNVCTGKLKGASVLDVNILRVINDNELIIRDIGNTLMVGPSTLSSAIKRLEKNGLLKRVICDNDLRSYAVHLTDEGKMELNSHHMREIEIMNKMLDKLESEEQKQLIYLLNKVTKS